MKSDDPASEALKAAHKAYQADWAAKNPDKMAVYRERKRLKAAAWRATDAGKAAMAARRQSDAGKAAKAAYHQRHAERLKAKTAVYRARPEVRKARQKRQDAYAARPEVKQRTKEYHSSPEYRARANARRAAKYATPIGCLSLRMSSAIRLCLKLAGSGKKPGSKWLDLVGYTAEELRAHIERQFVRGMGWHNMPEWHIDHIVPLSSFKFTTADGPEFKAAWALTNLRPLWGPLNVKKNARREFLL